jgi:large subunit ribosomal protein L22
MVFEMKGYSSEIPENCATARVEGANASYKDLSEVCGVIRNKKTAWALPFLEKAAEGEVPILFRRHNKNLGHRRELGGRKGRYPQKAARVVPKVLQSAIANGKELGLGEDFTIISVVANKKQTFPRMAPKGRTARSFLETSRVEVVLKGQPAPKKKEEKKAEAKKEAPKKEAPKAEAAKKEPEAGKEEKREQPNLLREEAVVEHEHKHEQEKILDSEHKHEEKPHQHGEYDKR